MGTKVCNQNSLFAGFTQWQLWVCDSSPPSNSVGQRPYSSDSGLGADSGCGLSFFPSGTLKPRYVPALIPISPSNVALNCGIASCR